MKKSLNGLIVLVLSGCMSLGGVSAALAQDSVGITYSKEYITDGQKKSFETPDGLIFEGIISELPDRNFTITVDPDKGYEGSEKKYDVEDVWVGKSTDGYILPISRHPFDLEGSEPEVKKTGDHTYSLEGLNIEDNTDYGFFIDANLRDSEGRAVGYSTFATFFRINPSGASQADTDGTGSGADGGDERVTYFWQNNAAGWWVQCSDGTYLTSRWYCSPGTDLWYYLGADGYMLTDTITPDGYRVNADGVWVQ